jgi:hypothetical protein
MIAHSILATALHLQASGISSGGSSIFDCSTWFQFRLHQKQSPHPVYRNSAIFVLSVYPFSAVVGLLPFSGRIAALSCCHCCTWFISTTSCRPIEHPLLAFPTTNQPRIACRASLYRRCCRWFALLIWALLGITECNAICGLPDDGLLAAGFKVRLPRLTSTVSVSFVVILVTSRNSVTPKPSRYRQRLRYFKPVGSTGRHRRSNRLQRCHLHSRRQ